MGRRAEPRGVTGAARSSQAFTQAGIGESARRRRHCACHPTSASLFGGARRWKLGGPRGMRTRGAHDRLGAGGESGRYPGSEVILAGRLWQSSVASSPSPMCARRRVSKRCAVRQESSPLWSAPSRTNAMPVDARLRCLPYASQDFFALIAVVLTASIPVARVSPIERSLSI